MKFYNKDGFSASSSFIISAFFHGIIFFALAQKVPLLSLSQGNNKSVHLDILPVSESLNNDPAHPQTQKKLKVTASTKIQQKKALTLPKKAAVPPEPKDLPRTLPKKTVTHPIEPKDFPQTLPKKADILPPPVEPKDLPRTLPKKTVTHPVEPIPRTLPKKAATVKPKKIPQPLPEKKVPMAPQKKALIKLRKNDSHKPVSPPQHKTFFTQEQRTDSTNKTSKVTKGQEGKAQDARQLEQAHGNRPLKYPKNLQRQGITGNLMLRYSVTKTGQVINMRVVKSSGYLDFDLEAAHTISTWKYKPGQGGETYHPVVFRLIRK